MIMIMIDNEYLFMYCIHVFMYTMIVIVQYAKYNDGKVIQYTNRRYKYKLWKRANVYQLSAEAVSTQWEDVKPACVPWESVYCYRSYARHANTGPHTRTQHIVSDINRNVQNARLGVISGGSGETHIVQTLP